MKYLGLILLATSVAGRFTDDFYRLLAKDSAKKNLIASPFSLEIAMTMSYMGAKEKTADEMRTVLKLPSDKKEVARKYKELLSDLKDREKDVILELANRVYVNDEFTLVPQYNEVMRESFKAEAVRISVSNPKESANTINQWVSNQTRGKIKELVKVDDINEHLRAVLLNAIYFKGQWKLKFEKKSTKQEDFRLSDTERTPVQMMSQSGKFNAAYLDDLDAKVVELPYRNSNLSMLIFLPNKVDGLSELENKIIGFSRPLNSQNVDVKIPRFKIEFERELSDLLKKMGIQLAFIEEGNFKGLVPQTPCYISKVLQKAFVEVNEEGAEASAATAVFQGTYYSIVRPHQMEFTADHPFAFIIRDEKTVYFQGHVVKP